MAIGLATRLFPTWAAAYQWAWEEAGRRSGGPAGLYQIDLITVPDQGIFVTWRVMWVECQGAWLAVREAATRLARPL